MSTPSMSQQELDAMSVVSDATTDHNDNSDAASDIEQLQRVLGAGVQVLSETIEEDLQQLHHLHVVSSVLDGGFRDNLERLFQVCTLQQKYFLEWGRIEMMSPLYSNLSKDADFFKCI